jgi:hypothetical protein
VNTVQSPQNNIVLKQYPLRHRLNQQMWNSHIFVNNVNLFLYSHNFCTLFFISNS